MTAMKPPRPIVTYELETGNAVRHASIHAALKALATSESYARNRINDGKPCKGFLLYDLQHAYTGETIAHVRKLSPAFDAAFKARSKQPDHEISVRIDPRTVILVKASKWTPDYAERYKARMEASKPPHFNYGDWMREKNDSIKPKTPKRGPGRPRKAVVREEEHNIQAACVRWFNLQWPEYQGLLFAVPNGGARSKATAGKLKAEGVVAGVADLIMLVPRIEEGCRYMWHALCIEMKTAKGRQSPEQMEWQRKVESNGYKYAVCHSLDEFMAVVNGYLT